MARYPGKEQEAVAKKGQGNKEAGGFMESSFGAVSNALWMLVWALVFVVELVLTAISLVTGLASLVLGILAAIATAIAGIAAKIAGVVSELRDEIKASFVNWKDRKDRQAAIAKQLEAAETR